eukprot:1264912-Amphidinium_carterae.4
MTLVDVKVDVEVDVVEDADVLEEEPGDVSAVQLVVLGVEAEDDALVFEDELADVDVVELVVLAEDVPELVKADVAEDGDVAAVDLVVEELMLDELDVVTFELWRPAELEGLVLVFVELDVLELVLVRLELEVVELELPPLPEEDVLLAPLLLELEVNQLVELGSPIVCDLDNVDDVVDPSWARH